MDDEMNPGGGKARDSWHIRRADAADTELVSVLAAVTFYEAYFEQDDPHDLAKYIVESFSQDTVREQLNDPDSAIFIISNVDGGAVGYAKLTSGSADPSIKTEKTIELKRIYLLERVWGTGSGGALLTHCEDFARSKGCNSIWLGVWQQNLRGQRFYSKHGFVKTGTLTFPYGDSVGINNVMEKKIHPG